MSKAVRLILIFALAWPPTFSYAQEQEPTPNNFRIFDLQTPVEAPESESKSEIAEQLFKIIKTGRGSHSLDTFQLLNQYAIGRSQAVDPEALSVEVVDLAGNVVETLSARSQKFFNSTSKEFEFRITYQGNLLHIFHVPVQSIGFYGNKLVFVKQNETQNISFIDLEFFKGALGKSELAIFNVPTFGENISELNLFEKQLSLPEKKLDQKVFELFSQVQQVAFNMTVLMADPKQAQAAVPLQEHFQAYFEKTVELHGESVVDQVASSEEYKAKLQEWTQAQSKQFGALTPQTVLAFIEEYEFKNPRLRELAQKYADGALDLKSFVSQASVLDARFVEALAIYSLQSRVSEAAQKTAQQIKLQKKLLNRVQLILALGLLPRPTGATSIKQALAAIAAGFSTNGIVLSDESVKENVLQILNHKGIRLGAGIAVGLGLGFAFPEQSSQFFYGSLDLTRTVFEGLWGKAKDISFLGMEAFKTTMDGLNLQRSFDVYTHPDTFSKFQVGLVAIVGILYAALGIPHLMVNGTQAVRDISKTYPQFREREGSVRRAVLAAFIDRQNQLEQKFQQEISERELKESGRLGYKFSAQDETEVIAKIKELETQEQPGVLSRWVENVKASSFYQKWTRQSDEKIESFGQAMRHFLFSFCSLSSSVRQFTRFWQGWFAIRSFVWFPATSAVALTYPNFYKVASEQRLPTKLNGGLTTRSEKMNEIEYQKHFRMFSDRDYLNEFKEWEERILEVEAKFHEHAIKKAFMATIKTTPSVNELQKFIQNGAPQGLTDDSIDRLSLKQKMFFRTYYQNYVEEAIRLFLVDVASRAEFPQLNAETTTAEELKRVTLQRPELISLDPASSEKYLTQVQDTKVFAQTQQQIRETNLAQTASRVIIDRARTKLDPKKNEVVARMKVVERQSQNPAAILRATRAMITSNIIDKPMELFFNFVCLSAIASGVMQPVQPEMFSENSWFHLSRMVFFNGYVLGVMTGVVAESWFKLQQDELNEGKFNDVPTGADAKKSYWSWFFKKTFKNPENSVWRNHKHFVKIMWSNMRAALTWTVVTGMLTLGRFDLDSYIVGYMTSYLLPMTGIAFKLEQGFELSSQYFAKSFKREHLAHPLVIKYVNTMALKKRFVFNFYYKIYENITANLIWAWTMMDSVTYGSRGFSRILTGGSSFTRLAIDKLDAVAEAGSSIPGFKPMVRACSRVFSNNFKGL
ncbi:MAG: hypothetical protein AB7F59_13010 [Bdellovibrionales bacterium]